MAQSSGVKPPFTDSNFSLPRSVVSGHDDGPLGNDKPSPLMHSTTEEEPPRKGDIFKRVTRKPPTATPTLQDSVAESSLTERTESQAISSIPPIEASEPPKPPSVSIFKKLTRPPVTNAPAVTNTDAVDKSSQPVVTPSVVSRRPLFITPVKKTGAATVLQSISLDTIPLGSIASTTKSAAGKLPNPSLRRYHGLALDGGVLQREHEQNTNLQSAKVLQDLADDLLTSTNRRIEPSEDYAGTYKSRATTCDFDDDLSDII
ncbi:Hypothetical protein DHA2_154465 [Giardia duodenalis]|uniref:Uncharacterized protein n=1 Tax=Giardia intestinalis TaxID=5741 RepID=V6TEF8_GIAIN|nr:Hypothetical protein DHA2_154465 [Giardia intestinalis]